MSANLEIRDGQASFISGNNKTAWHGLGTIVAGSLTAEQVIKGARLDYNVKLAPTTAQITRQTDFEVIHSIHKNKFSTYREDTEQPLGIVKGRYEIVQNLDAFKFFDAIIESGEAIFETAGVLGVGERIFVTAKLPNDFTVGGEECKKYTVLTNSHDGTSSILAFLTSVRVVCENTLQAALANLTNKISIPHVSGAKERLAEAYKLMGISSIYMKEVSEIFNAMAKKSITDENLKKYIIDVMNVESRKENEEVEVVLSKIMQNRVDSIYEFALSHPTQQTNATRGTLWGAYNAISAYPEHIKEFKSNEDKYKSILFGAAGSKTTKGFQRAYELL